MKQPKVSVIMGVYNAEKYLEQAILSILSQTYTNLEFIIINDGSSDASHTIASSIKDERIILISQDNMGLTKSLNKAIQASTGQLIARQDADDISIFNRLEKQVDFLNRNPSIGLVGSSMFITNSSGTFNEIYNYPSSHEDLLRAMPHFNPIVHGSVMFRRESIKDVGGYNEDFRYVQDYELWSRYIQKYKIHNIKSPLYARIRDNFCSEEQVDKSGYVNKIQSNMNMLKARSNTEPFLDIVSSNFYPYIGLPFTNAKTLGATYKNMYLKAKKLGLNSRKYYLNSYRYFPYQLFL
jgi:glycosyltransferase involved in cell wall biosynthesis